MSEPGITLRSNRLMVQPVLAGRRDSLTGYGAATKSGAQLAVLPSQVSPRLGRFRDSNRGCAEARHLG